MTKKQCYCCSHYKRNTLNIIGYFIEEWCDISNAHNKFFMTNKKCPFFKDNME